MIAIVGLLFCGMTLVKIIRLSIHVRQCYITCDTREAVFKEFILNPLPIISLAFVHPKLQASGGDFFGLIDRYKLGASQRVVTTV